MDDRDRETDESGRIHKNVLITFLFSWKAIKKCRVDFARKRWDCIESEGIE